MSSETSSKKDVPKLVRCPGCGKRAVYDLKNPFRPFCSPLCKNEDVINWAEQRYFIAAGNASEGQEDRVSSSQDQEEDV